MAGAARVGDQQSHGGMAILGSSNVFVDGLPAHRLFDMCYCPEGDPVHGVQPLITASSKVFANGMGLGRIGDQYACGAIVVQGSSKVFVG